MLRLGNANAIVMQGLIAQKGLDCLKALISQEFENKPEGEGEVEEKEKNTSLQSASSGYWCSKIGFTYLLHSLASKAQSGRRCQLPFIAY